jgi:hypothetical protein
MIEIKCEYTEMVDIDRLVENPRNPNHHPERQIEILVKNLKHQGFRHPLIVSKRSGFLVVGHGRLEAAKKLGVEKVPVDYQDFESEAVEYQFMVADNKLATLAEHDDSFMIETIKELDLIDMDFELLGMDDFSFKIKEPDVKNTGAELNVDSFDNFQHQCPKCGFEWNDNGQDNS